jgi:hypothetical protein
MTPTVLQRLLNRMVRRCTRLIVPLALCLPFTVGGQTAHVASNQSTNPKSAGPVNEAAPQSNANPRANPLNTTNANSSESVAIGAACPTGVTALTAAATNGRLNVVCYAGADAGAKIKNCIEALPSSGGICDATALTASQTISNTITLPKNTTLKLGRTSYTAYVVPVFILNDNSELAGAGWRDVAGYGTTITLLGTTGGQALRLVSWGNGSKIPGGSAAKVQIHDIEIIGTSTSDGSIGFDLQGMQMGNIARNRIQNFQTGIRTGWGTWHWNCDCYSRFDDNQVVSALIAVDMQASTNANTWIGGNFQPFIKGGIGFKLGGWVNRILAADVENFPGGIAFDFTGSSNEVTPLDVESGGSLAKFEATASSNTIHGGSAASLNGNAVVYSPGTDTEFNLVYGVENVAPWPLTWGSYKYDFGEGSSPNYYQIYGHPSCSNCGLELMYNSTTQAQFVYGLAGHAPLTLGALRSYGGIKSGGMLSIHSLPDPSAPTLTNVGAPGTTTYRYAIVCHDYNEGVSAVSAAAQTTTGNSALSSTDYNNIAWNCGDGYMSADILKWNGAAWQRLNANSAGTGPTSSLKYPFKDNGQPTSAYTDPTRNTTGDMSISGQLTASSNISSPAFAGTAPALLSAGPASGVGTSIACAPSHVCDQFSGTVTLTAGTGPTKGTLYTVTMVSRVHLPNCIFTLALSAAPYTAIASILPIYSPTQASLNIGLALTGTTSYTSTYICGGR